MMRRWTLVLTGIMVLTSCSISVEPDSRQLDDTYRISIVPRASDEGQLGDDPIIVYLIQGPDLYRRVRVTSSPPTPDVLLQELAKGPSDREQSNGLRSALGSTTIVIESITQTDRTITIDLASGFLELPGDEQTLLIGQISLTLFENLPISTITYTLAGFPTPIVGPGGVIIDRPIERSDFRPLVVNLR